MSSSEETHNEAMHDDFKPIFRVDDRVFCHDDNALYEATIKKVSFSHGEWRFLVHYLGWNSRWDKWLSAESILKDTPENRKVFEGQKQEAEESRKRKRQSTPQTNKKRYEGPSWQDYCELPFSLKTILVDDRERVMRLGFDSPNGYDCDVRNWRPARDVHHLPAAVTIQAVLNHYVKVQKKDKAEDAASAAEEKARKFVDELSAIFQEALPVCLLYQPERAQYAALKADASLQNKPLVEIYGCEFLLRFFTRLPVLLEEAGPSGRSEMGQQIADLIILLQRNRQVCFKANYRQPKEEELNSWEKSLRDGASKIPMTEE
jgi:mortality factor 4-like protein 1